MDDDPIMSFERMYHRDVPRTDWPERLEAAMRATNYEGVVNRDPNLFRALKSSPVWKALGKGEGGFKDALDNNGKPPYAHGSGMGRREVEMSERGQKDFSKMTQAEWVRHLGETEKKYIPYNKITSRPEFRGVEKDVIFNSYNSIPTAERKKYAEGVEKLYSQIKKTPAHGIKTAGNDGFWFEYEINKDSHKEGTPRHKSYVTLGLGNERLTSDQQLGFMKALQSAGYNGKMKFTNSAGRVLDSFDNIVMHASSADDARMVEGVARRFFGDKVSGFELGTDFQNGDGKKSSSQILELIANHIASKRNGYIPLTTSQNTNYFAHKISSFGLDPEDPNIIDKIKGIGHELPDSRRTIVPETNSMVVSDGAKGDEPKNYDIIPAIRRIKENTSRGIIPVSRPLVGTGIIKRGETVDADFDEPITVNQNPDDIEMTEGKDGTYRRRRSAFEVGRSWWNKGRKSSAEWWNRSSPQFRNFASQGVRGFASFGRRIYDSTGDVLGGMLSSAMSFGNGGGSGNGGNIPPINGSSPSGTAGSGGDPGNSGTTPQNKSKFESEWFKAIHEFAKSVRFFGIRTKDFAAKFGKSVGAVGKTFFNLSKSIPVFGNISRGISAGAHTGAGLGLGTAGVVGSAAIGAIVTAVQEAIKATKQNNDEIKNDQDYYQRLQGLGIDQKQASLTEAAGTEYGVNQQQSYNVLEKLQTKLNKVGGPEQDSQWLADLATVDVDALGIVRNGGNAYDVLRALSNANRKWAQDSSTLGRAKYQKTLELAGVGFGQAGWLQDFNGKVSNPEELFRNQPEMKRKYEMMAANAAVSRKLNITQSEYALRSRNLRTIGTREAAQANGITGWIGGKFEALKGQFYDSGPVHDLLAEELQRRDAERGMGNGDIQFGGPAPRRVYGNEERKPDVRRTEYRHSGVSSLLPSRGEYNGSVAPVSLPSHNERFVVDTVPVNSKSRGGKFEALKGQFYDSGPVHDLLAEELQRRDAERGIESGRPGRVSFRKPTAVTHSPVNQNKQERDYSLKNMFLSDKNTAAGWGATGGAIVGSMIAPGLGTVIGAGLGWAGGAAYDAWKNDESYLDALTDPDAVGGALGSLVPGGVGKVAKIGAKATKLIMKPGLALGKVGARAVLGKAGARALRKTLAKGTRIAGRIGRFGVKPAAMLAGGRIGSNLANYLYGQGLDEDTVQQILAQEQESEGYGYYWGGDTWRSNQFEGRGLSDDQKLDKNQVRGHRISDRDFETGVFKYIRNGSNDDLLDVMGLPGEYINAGNRIIRGQSINDYDTDARAVSQYVNGGRTEHFMDGMKVHYDKEGNVSLQGSKFTKRYLSKPHRKARRDSAMAAVERMAQSPDGMRSWTSSDADFFLKTVDKAMESDVSASRIKFSGKQKEDFEEWFAGMERNGVLGQETDADRVEFLKSEERRKIKEKGMGDIARVLGLKDFAGLQRTSELYNKEKKAATYIGDNKELFERSGINIDNEDGTRKSVDEIYQQTQSAYEKANQSGDKVQASRLKRAMSLTGLDEYGKNRSDYQKVHANDDRLNKGLQVLEPTFEKFGFKMSAFGKDKKPRDTQAILFDLIEGGNRLAKGEMDATNPLVKLAGEFDAAQSSELQKEAKAKRDRIDAENYKMRNLKKGDDGYDVYQRNLAIKNVKSMTNSYDVAKRLFGSKGFGKLSEEDFNKTNEQLRQEAVDAAGGVSDDEVKNLSILERNRIKRRSFRRAIKSFKDRGVFIQAMGNKTEGLAEKSQAVSEAAAAAAQSGNEHQANKEAAKEAATAKEASGEGGETTTAPTINVTVTGTQITAAAGEEQNWDELMHRMGVQIAKSIVEATPRNGLYG